MSDLDARADDEASKLGDVAAAAGLGRVHFLAWRDLDDPEAGGSEVHAHEIARRWARAGIEVSFRTSYAPGLTQVAWRDGYRVIRKAGRYLVFPRAAISEVMGWHGHARRAGRDLERDAVLLAPLGPRTPRRVPAPRPRRDVGHVASTEPGPPRSHDRVNRRAVDLPPHAHDHAVAVVEARARRRSRLPRGSGVGGGARDRPAVLCGGLGWRLTGRCELRLVRS